jgi:hypothetical protein
MTNWHYDCLAKALEINTHAYLVITLSDLKYDGILMNPSFSSRTLDASGYFIGLCTSIPPPNN